MVRIEHGTSKSNYRCVGGRVSGSLVEVKELRQLRITEADALLLLFLTSRHSQAVSRPKHRSAGNGGKGLQRQAPARPTEASRLTDGKRIDVWENQRETELLSFLLTRKGKKKKKKDPWFTCRLAYEGGSHNSRIAKTCAPFEVLPFDKLSKKLQGKGRWLSLCGTSADGSPMMLVRIRNSQAVHVLEVQYELQYKVAF